MAATYRTSSAGGGSSGTGNRTSTISAVAGDLLIVAVQWSGNSNTSPTCTDNQSGTYSLVLTARNNLSADICAIFVRNQVVASTATITVAPVVGSGNNTAGEILTVAISGATKFGLSAIKQSAKQENQITGAPAPTLASNAQTAHMTLTYCGSSTTAGSVPNASWTERQDASQTSPVTSLEVATRNSGFTGTSAPYVSVASIVWNAAILEINADNTVDQTTTGKARIRKTVDQTTTGKARIRKTVDQTITGKATVVKTVDQTVTGKADIRKTVDRTITGKAAIQKQVDQTVTGKAAIRKTVDQAITGKSDIRKVVDQTVAGTARVQKSVDQTVTGKAGIRKTTDQTITGKSDIRKTVDQTISGVANIENVGVDQTITGKADIRKTVDQTITGKGRLQDEVDQTTFGVSRIQKSVDQGITGTSRLQDEVDQTITGTGNILNTIDQDQTGVAAIQQTTDQVILGTSSISYLTDAVVTGTANIYGRVDATITGVANIHGSTAQTITGVARIDACYYSNAPVSLVIDGMVFGKPVRLPTWTTACRPSSPLRGAVGYNVETTNIELYTGYVWRTMATSLL